MTAFAAFDRDIYPGDAIMAALKSGTNLAICGVYLAPAPSHGDTSWMPAALPARQAGWGTAAIYVGQELPTGPGQHKVTAAQGQLDGVDAVALALSAGYDPGARVFLDLENPGMAAPGPMAYVTAWALTVQGAGLQPDIYVGHGGAAAIRAALTSAGVKGLSPKSGWAYRVATVALHDVATISTADPSGSGDPAALGWQHDQNCNIAVPGHGKLNVDLSTFAVRDPSAPAP